MSRRHRDRIRTQVRTRIVMRRLSQMPFFKSQGELYLAQTAVSSPAAFMRERAST